MANFTSLALLPATVPGTSRIGSRVVSVTSQRV
jgi:hypothetical protein